MLGVVFEVRGLNKVHPWGVVFVVNENPLGSDCECQLDGDGLDDCAETECFIVREFAENQEFFVGAVCWVLVPLNIPLGILREWSQSLYVYVVKI